MSTDLRALLAKYDVPGPRYTSYPSVPYWETAPDEVQWLELLQQAFDARTVDPGPVDRGPVDASQRTDAAQGAALYVHIPFCQSLCTFCGCNTRITRSHSIVGPYIDTLLAELDIYRQRLGVSRLPVSELYLGGGTPTFLTQAELTRLMEGLFARITPGADLSASVEIDPRVTHADQLELLARFGFRHLSAGVQDFDPRVQAIVNREQSEHQTRETIDAARRFGFQTISLDLIHGLPLQSAASVNMTMDTVSRLRPERIALYAYAHVPWIKPGQRRFTENELPEEEQRRALYELARLRLAAEGYHEIGLDHFALASDPLWQAQRAGMLNRNFMGYSSLRAQPLIGLGVSSMGDAGSALVQNDKDLQPYQDAVASGQLPLQRGHLLTTEDRVLRGHILRLVTRFETRWEQACEQTPYLADIAARLAEPQRDGLVVLDAHGCRVTETGRPFLRNLCMAFDARQARRLPHRSLVRSVRTAS
ncbi:MAG TPA: oxygen-independent coproporphyrinogen III oxidase [Steroidobacteraceae bacterium]|jgi:oxygen-independent coproporphyrinogen-3 oxidase|nr:oxygen-independent coproporphyrinogen III oxidase [Steroidobacteraceae bacterium]